MAEEHMRPQDHTQTDDPLTICAPDFPLRQMVQDCMHLKVTPRKMVLRTICTLMAPLTQTVETLYVPRGGPNDLWVETTMRTWT